MHGVTCLSHDIILRCPKCDFDLIQFETPMLTMFACPNELCGKVWYNDGYELRDFKEDAKAGGFPA